MFERNDNLSESSSEIEQKKQQCDNLKRFQKLQAIIRKPTQQMNEVDKHKQRIINKITNFIDKTQQNDIQMKNQPKSSIKVVPKITRFSADQKEYVDYLIQKKRKQQEATRNKSPKKKVQENYDQFWQETLNTSEREEIQDSYNVEKQLHLVHSQQIQKANLQKVMLENKTCYNISEQRQSPILEMKSLTNSRVILFQDQDYNPTETREHQLELTHKQIKTNKVIQIVQHATKKIYNKKDEQIKREMIMHRISHKMQKLKDNPQSLDSGQRNSASTGDLCTQKLITNKILINENRFYQLPSCYSQKQCCKKPKLGYLSQIHARIPSPMRKISQLNDQINAIVSQIDTIQKKESVDEFLIFKELQSEKDQYKTYGKSLQPDQIQETLKSLLGPSNQHFRKPLRFNNKKFFNQIL